MRLRSWRHFYDGTYGRVDDLVAHPSIRLFFYRFGNSRNLSCLMCNSNSSSAFGQEAAAIGEGGWKTISNSTGLSEDELKGIQVLYLGGGEPSMAKECLSLVDRLATLGNTQCAIVLNTNASLPKSPFFEKLKAFKYARVGFSIDGIGESYNLIRYPMLWNKLNDNICFLFTKYPKFNYEIWFTLNNLNLCEFPLFLDWWLNLCADSPQAHVQLNLSEVTHPEFLRPDLCSPSEVRRAMDAVAQFLTDPRVTVNRDRVESIRRASLMLSLLKENSKAADLISMRNQFIARRQEYRRVLPDVKI